MPAREPTDAEVEAALGALTDRDRFRAAESRVARFVPQLQRILAHALSEGGWFDQAHDQRLAELAREPDEAGRVAGMRTLLAEETRMGMLVGVAVGWELCRELDHREDPIPED